MKKIFWIASYPRSGNTWMRAILSSLFFTKNGRFNLNLLNYITNFDNPDKYEFVRSLNSIDFKKLHELSVISKYWSEAQKRAKICGDFAFFKTQSGNVTLNKLQYTTANNVLGLIYLIRDPRDVVVSYSKYTNNSIDETIKSITSKNCITWSGLPKNNPYPILLSSWDIHYKTWKILNVPKIVIKYEDLLKDTRSLLSQIINFFINNYGFNFNYIEMVVDNILETTHFNQLHANEKRLGFKEAPYFFSKKKTPEYFFRKGTDKQWQNELSAIQIKKIESSFEPTMREFGYLK